MTNKTKAAIEEAAIKAWEADAFHNPNPNNPHAYVYGFKQGAKEVIDHPERYSLYTKEQYEQALKDGYNQGLSDGARQTVDYVNKNILK